MSKILTMLTSLELCAGAGGQALGIEKAGFTHQAVIEIDKHCRQTLFANRPKWNITAGDQADLKTFLGAPFKGIDLVAGGLPCPPFSLAGKRLGAKDDRDLFPDALRIIDECRPNAVMIENVKGFLSNSFESYRDQLKTKFKKLGYIVDWKILHASDFGVSQERPRLVIIALKKGTFANYFEWPTPFSKKPKSVGVLLGDLMKENGWREAEAWIETANKIAPTLVGGSKKHGGADLGPTRAKEAWLKLGVDGKGIADAAPGSTFHGYPRLTLKMVARLQGFPDSWEFSGGKTSTYRQIGNAFPSPVANAVAKQVAKALCIRRSIPIVK